MDPEQRIRQLCRRYGLPPEAGARLLPLAHRATDAPAPVRARLLALIERALARKAEEQALERREQEAYDERCLLGLAGVLHTWEPGQPPPIGPGL
jgi:hypothetical protein